MKVWPDTSKRATLKFGIDCCTCCGEDEQVVVGHD